MIARSCVRYFANEKIRVPKIPGECKFLDIRKREREREMRENERLTFEREIRREALLCFGRYRIFSERDG